MQKVPFPACGLLGGAACGLGSVGIGAVEGGIEGVETVLARVFGVMLGDEGRLKPIVLRGSGVAKVVPTELTVASAVSGGAITCTRGEGELSLTEARSFSPSLLAGFVAHGFPVPASSIIALACSTR